MLPNRVLLADPDAGMVRQWQEALKIAKFDVETAGDGLECVAQLRRFQPNLLVLAPDLPWGSGEGVLALMYEDPEIPCIPVILLASRRDARQARSLGAFPISAYCVKPVAPEDLAEVVGRIIWKRYARREPLAEA